MKMRMPRLNRLRSLFNQLMMIGAFVAGLTSCAHAATVQKNISRIDQMANVPQPLEVIDFHDLAKKFDSTVYDFKQTGAHWPLIWWDLSGLNFNQPVVGLYTAIGDSRQGTSVDQGRYHEAVTSMGAVLGASLVGVDKAHQDGLNYVGMLKNYFNRATGWNIMQNNTNPVSGQAGGGYGRDWWYDIFPNVMFYGIYSLYPNEPDFDWIAKSIADKFYEADKILAGNYHYSFFNYEKMQPANNQICAQPDAAAGHSYVLYSAYKKFGDARYLEGAKRAMDALEAEKINPSYEVLMPFGAYLAARMNAEQDTSYDVSKMIDFSLDGTAICRAGWGAIVGQWNGVDVSGIIGSTVDNGGYGFLMNTYDMAWPLVPLVRYDQSYANAIGKWALNAANAAKLFYPDHASKEQQTLKDQSDVTKGVIAYEGLSRSSGYDKYKSVTTSPVAQGDGPRWTPTNPEISQFSVYGSAHVGIFGSIVKTTNVDGILQLDLLATDFFRDAAYPSYLFSNPYDTEKAVDVTLPDHASHDLYDTVGGLFIARGVSDKVSIHVAAKSSVVLVVAPAAAKAVVDHGRLIINDVVVDYHVH